VFGALAQLAFPTGLDMSRMRPYSAPDPGNIFYERPGLASTTPYTDASGKTPRSITINPAEKTLIMICVGQSLNTSNVVDTFTPTNASKLDNMSWYDGKNYAASNALLGTGWAGSTGASHNYNLKIADGIISNGKFDRVILIMCAMGGTTVNFWANDGALAGEATGYWRCISAAAKKLAAQGITPSTPGVKFLIKWNQGESDTQQSTSQASYMADFNKMKARVALDLPGAKWMVAKESWYIGATSATVQAAQLALVDNVTVFAGENMDSIDNTGRVGDQTHLNATGANSAATMGIAAITAITF
jgi:hypothetical protein